jgi:hypothetical protein
MKKLKYGSVLLKLGCIHYNVYSGKGQIHPSTELKEETVPLTNTEPNIPMLDDVH